MDKHAPKSERERENRENLAEARKHRPLVEVVHASDIEYSVVYFPLASLVPGLKMGPRLVGNNGETALRQRQVSPLCITCGKRIGVCS